MNILSIKNVMFEMESDVGKEKIDRTIIGQISYLEDNHCKFSDEISGVG